MKGRKPLRNGRDDGYEQFTVLHRSTLRCPAWAALGTAAQALYPQLRMEWKGAKANNNGKIRLSVRQAATMLGVTADTAARAFRDLQAKGFIVVTEMACLGVDGHGRSPAFELTELAMPGQGHEGRKLYREWRKGHDCPVVIHPTSNPSGRNGKNRTPSPKPGRPHHENRDVDADPVTINATPCPENRDVVAAARGVGVTETGTSLITIPMAKRVPQHKPCGDAQNIVRAARNGTD